MSSVFASGTYSLYGLTPFTVFLLRDILNSSSGCPRGKMGVIAPFQIPQLPWANGNLFLGYFLVGLWSLGKGLCDAICGPRSSGFCSRLFFAAPEQVTVSGHGSMPGRNYVREVSVSLHWPLCDPATLGSAALFLRQELPAFQKVILGWTRTSNFSLVPWLA